jgi:reactive intermediate/imine deaminase
MNRTAISTTDAPEAIGPYSQAVKVNNTVYLSGQIPLQPETGALVSGDLTVQARQVFNNLAAVAQASGGKLSDVVKLTIYLTDLQHFSTINELMAGYFSPPYPARATVAVAALPKGAQIEIDAVMVIAQQNT